jgi:hypothetical protein
MSECREGTRFLQQAPRMENPTENTQAQSQLPWLEIG